MLLRPHSFKTVYCMYGDNVHAVPCKGILPTNVTQERLFRNTVVEKASNRIWRILISFTQILNTTTYTMLI